jgi:hypothetical protein
MPFDSVVHRVIYGAIHHSRHDGQHYQKEFNGIMTLDLMLCSAFDCRNKLSAVNSIENRVYKVVPGLPGATDDFEKPAIETIAAHSVTYHET